jgi:hypothetical protein
VQKPTNIPSVVTLLAPRSVNSIGVVDDEEESSPTELKLFLYPCWLSSPYAHRRLCFSFNKKPKIEFPYINVGETTLMGKKVFLLLED